MNRFDSIFNCISDRKGAEKFDSTFNHISDGKGADISLHSSMFSFY